MASKIIALIFCVVSLSAQAQDTTGRYSIKMTPQVIDFIFKLIDSSALPAKVANGLKVDWIEQVRQQQVKVPPTKKEGKKE